MQANAPETDRLAVQEETLVGRTSTERITLR